MAVQEENAKLAEKNRSRKEDIFVLTEELEAKWTCDTTTEKPFFKPGLPALVNFLQDEANRVIF